MPRAAIYTAAERAALAALYHAGTKADIMAAVPGRSWNALQLQAAALGVVRQPGNWSEAELLILSTDYPSNGAKYVAALVGKDEEEVRRKAWQQHISRLPATAEQRAQRAAKLLITRRNRYLKNLAERPKQTVKLAPVPKPVVVKAEPLLAVKRSAKTPVLNVAKEARRRKEASQRIGLAEAIARHKTLRYGQPEHTAFLCGGLLGWQQWQAKQAA